MIFYTGTCHDIHISGSPETVQAHSGRMPFQMISGVFCISRTIPLAHRVSLPPVEVLLWVSAKDHGNGETNISAVTSFERRPEEPHKDLMAQSLAQTLGAGGP